MISNHVKIAVRNLLKKKGFSTINILGLALGLATTLLILLWVQDERSVNAFHQKGDRLYQVYTTSYYDSKVAAGDGTPPLLPAEITKVIPEIEAATGYSWDDTRVFSAKGKIIKENGHTASPDFFAMFSYPLLAGNVKDALNGPLSIAISREMALAFFGAPADAIGKTIRYDNEKRPLP